VNSQNLLEFAFKHKVMIVAPMNFYAYLQTVVFGLNQLHIEAQAQEIKIRVAELRSHLHNYTEGYRKLGHYLGLAVSSYNKTGGELRKVDKDMQRITVGKATEEQTLTIDTLQENPRTDE
jgi:DNA anti-recombination protein RmuC